MNILATIIVVCVIWSVIWSVIFCCPYFMQWKYILKDRINKANDPITNISSVIPSEDDVVRINEKALAYFQDIKEPLSSEFNCKICLMDCGSIPERFAALLIIDCIEEMNPADILLPDQDFLIKPNKITACYSAQPDTIEIVQSESFVEEGYAKLRVSKRMAETFNLEEGYLSTTTIKESVKRCILKNYKRVFLGLQYVHSSSGNPTDVKIHGPAVKVKIKRSSVYSADFTFAIPCFEWPRESDWPLREKKWPNQTVVTTIMNLGFHFVPKNQENDKSKLTWRYSFSLAERELSKEVNEIVRKCFFLP